MLGTGAVDDAAKGGDHVSFDAKPIVQIVIEISVQAAEIERKRRGLEVNVLVADGQIPAVAFVVISAGRRRGSIGQRQRWSGSGGKSGEGRRRGKLGDQGEVERAVKAHG